MTVKTVVEYTDKEINSMIDVLNILSDMLDNDGLAHQIKQKAETAFDKVSTLLCLDEKGEQAFERAGW